jgi:hypothetical protein
MERQLPFFATFEFFLRLEATFDHAMQHEFIGRVEQIGRIFPVSKTVIPSGIGSSNLPLSAPRSSWFNRGGPFRLCAEEDGSRHSSADAIHPVPFRDG